MNFEIHVTIDKKDAILAEMLAKEQHWKTSKIDGDPVLGAKPFFYLTTHTSDFKKAYDRMNTMVNDLGANGIFVIREKIELIVHDVKYV